MSDWWNNNRDDLGKVILHWGVLGMLGIIGSAWVGIWKLEEYIRDDLKGWYWASTIAFSVLVPVVGIVAYWVLFVRARPEPAPPPPKTEEERCPLTFEAEHIIAVVSKDAYCTLIAMFPGGRKGNIYNSGEAIICDGHDAHESLRYDEARDSLMAYGYLSATAQYVYKLTASGLRRAGRLPERDYPTKFDPPKGENAPAANVASVIRTPSGTTQRN